MSEVAGTPAPAGDGGGGAPAPAPAPAPAAPAAPQAPAPDAGGQPSPTPNNQPAAPAATPPAEPKLTPEEQAQKAEDDEWDAAEKEIFPGLKSRNKDAKNNEQTKPEEKPKDGEAPKDPNAPKDGEQEPGSGDDTKPKGDGTQEDGNKPDANGQDPSAATPPSRTDGEIAQQKQSIATELRGKLFPDLKDTLTDADGDPIRGPQDVMKLIDPDTITEDNPQGETFEAAKAVAWFQQQQAIHEANMKQANETLSQLADLHYDITQQLQNVTAKYGKWLSEHPEDRDAIWAEINGSLQRDPKSGMIIGMPLGIETYYDRVVGPQVKAAEQAPSAAAPQAGSTPPAETPEQKAEREAKEKADAEAQRRKDRADRSDIYQPPADPNQDPEDAEWAEAERQVFGDKIANRKKK